MVPKSRADKNSQARAKPSQRLVVERVQIGVRLEKRMVKVLKGLAEFDGITLGELLENIVLHSFEPVPGDEGESCASPHSKAALGAIRDLQKIYGMDYDVHALRRSRREAHVAHT